MLSFLNSCLLGNKHLKGNVPRHLRERPDKSSILNILLIKCWNVQQCEIEILLYIGVKKCAGNRINNVTTLIVRREELHRCRIILQVHWNVKICKEEISKIQ